MYVSFTLKIMHSNGQMPYSTLWRYFLAFLHFRYTASRRPAPQHRPTSQVQRVQTGPETLQRSGQDREQGKKLSRKRLPLQPAATLPRSWWQTGPAGYRAGSEEPAFSHVKLLHRSSSFRLVRSTTAFLTSSLNWLSFASTDGRSLRSAFLTFFWVYSVECRRQGVRIAGLEEDQVLGWGAAAVLFHRIVHAVLPGDLLKLLDGGVVDLDVGNALVLADQLLHRLLALGE